MLLAGGGKRIKRGKKVFGQIQLLNIFRLLRRSWVVTEKVTLLGFGVDAFAFSFVRSDWLLFLAPLLGL